jgi:hypothetical protein
VARADHDQAASRGLAQRPALSDSSSFSRRSVSLSATAALLQPRVPGDPDAGKRGHLFAPKPRRAAPAGGRKSELLGGSPLPPGPQEGAELETAGLVGTGAAFRGGHLVTV